MATKQKGAQLLIECLVKHNVKYIFGIPGAKIDAAFDALLDSPIKLIICRHEQNAAFMAAAYGRLTGQPGVVLVTSGPGVSNLATGLLTATTEGDPVIAIGGNVARNMLLKESHQKIDNTKLMAAVTKAQADVVVAENIPEIVQNAFRIATAPRSGAVFISVPQDILTKTTETPSGKISAPILQGSAPRQSIIQTAKMLNEAKQPILLLGLEASRPENAAAVRNLLQQKPMATIGTFQAAGVISRELLECFIGRVGLFKNQPGDALLDAADIVLAIGFDPVEYDPEIWNIKQKKKIISFDYNPVNIHNAYSPDLEVIGNIALNLEELTPLLKSRDLVHNIPLVQKLHQELTDTIAGGAKISGKLMHPLRFIYDLRNNIDDDVIVISDIGTHHMWLAHYFLCFSPHHLLFSNGQQTLGVALPWAIATNFARPGKQVISISGDGGFLFSSNELETAVREKVHFVHFVWCDGSYDMVKQQQLIKYKRTCGIDFGYVDIVKYAESFGAKGFRINHADDFVGILKTAMKTAGPVLVEVSIDYSENAKLFSNAYTSPN
jgi:acetolactate synthase-1/2/3 large subunit